MGTGAFPQGEVTRLLTNLQDNIVEFNRVQTVHDEYQHQLEEIKGWREREDEEVRSRLEEASLQYSHLLSSTPRTVAYANRRRPAESWEQTRLRLVLDFPYYQLVPQDRRERELLKQHLANSIAASTAVDPARVKILELRPGSVIVIASIRPDPKQQDLRDPDDLLSVLQRDANNPRSELSSVYRLVSAEHARHSEAARAAAEGEGYSEDGNRSPYHFLSRPGASRVPTHQSSRNTPSMPDTAPRPSQASMPMYTTPATMPTLKPVDERPSAVKFHEEELAVVEVEDTRHRTAGGVVVDGLLEVFVLEACNLPTAEFTRAFAVLQIDSHKARTSTVLGHADGRSKYDAARGAEEGEVALWGRDGALTSLEQLQASQRGQAHRTHVVEGLDPVWGRGFRLKVSDRHAECVRIQILHKGYMATEFIGEVVLEVAELLEVIARRPSTADNPPKVVDHRVRSASGALTLLLGQGHPGWRDQRPLLSSSPMQGQPQPRQGYDTAVAQLPPGERELEGGPTVRASWYALRTVAGGKVRSRLGTDCELRLGFRWSDGVSQNLKEQKGMMDLQVPGEDGGYRWDARHFWLEPLEQVLRHAHKDVVLGRMSIRGATATDSSRKVGHSNVIEVKTPTNSLTVAARNSQEQKWWIDAINTAGGIAKPPAKPPALVRFRWPLLCCLLLLVLACIALLVYFLEFRDGLAKDRFELEWFLCGGAACATCDCYKRCWFGSTLAWHLELDLMHHRCADRCDCQLPPPIGECGDGHRHDVVVDWYGRDVLFHEECDDGNAASGDGCSSDCKIEGYMMLLEQNTRLDLSYENGTRSLCGGNHSWPECERSCLESDGCSCAWFGGGLCHHYSVCRPTTSTMDNLEISWSEVEYQCGADSFIQDPDMVDIRAALILFGSDVLDEDEQLRFSFALQDTLLDPCDPCTTTIVGMEPGTLPSAAADDMRRAAVSSAAISADRRTGHEAGSHATNTSVPMTTPPSSELDVVVVRFKMTTLNSTALAVVSELQTFVESGQEGFLGELQKEGFFSNLRGLIFSPGEGEPHIRPRPAPPPDGGQLFRKRPFTCVPHRFPPFGEHRPEGDVHDLCCGNVSGVCSPPLLCYISTELQYDCVAARPPYAPTDVLGIPSDAQADATWNAPQDHGGFDVLAYRIEKVQFVLNGTGYEVAVPATPTNATEYTVDGLENFRPYYLRVLAINRIGVGPPSLPSPPLTPSVHAPRAPLHGMGETGNHRVWIKWEPVIFDGGRPLTGYILELRNRTGWFRLRLEENRAITNVLPLSGQYSVSAFDPASVRPLARRLLQTTTMMTTSPAPQVRNCSHRGGHCDPLATEFMIVGDLNGDPLVNGFEYQFRIFSRNSHSVSRASDVIAITPTGEPPQEVVNLTATCHDSIQPAECTEGTGGLNEITIAWAPPADDGGSPVVGYLIAISSDQGSTFTQVLPQSVSDANTRTYSITNLTNDVAYNIQVSARNARGNGTKIAIGPITPRQCLHMETCQVCIEPYYEVWGNQCEPPLCYNQGSAANHQTRLVDCTPDGCRVEIYYAEEWGTVDGSSTTELSTDLVCTELGLRPRPADCGMETCTSKVQPAPAVGDSPYIWLQGITCRGIEPSIHDCPASMGWRTDPATNEYGIGKWYVPLATHDRDLGICCWEPIGGTATGGNSSGGTTAAAPGGTPSPGTPAGP